MTTTIALVVLTVPVMAVTFTDGVPLYTNADLEKMFGPAPKSTAVSKTSKAPAERTEAEDWAAIQRFIDSQYARIDAERQYDMERRAMAEGYGQGACPAPAEDGYSGSYFPAYWLYPYYGSSRHDFRGRFYRPNNPQLPFGDRTLPRALPPGGLHPTVKTHPTAPMRFQNFRRVTGQP